MYNLYVEVCIVFLVFFVKTTHLLLRCNPMYVQYEESLNKFGSSFEI